MATYEKDYSDKDLEALYQLNEDDLYEKIGKFFDSPPEEQPNLRKTPNKILPSVLLIAAIVTILLLIIVGFIFVPRFMLWGVATVFIAFIISAIGASLLLPAFSADKERSRKANWRNKGKEIFYKYMPEIQKILCKEGKPRSMFDEDTKDTIRRIAESIISDSLPITIVYYIAVLILKKGLNKFCAIDFKNNSQN